MKKEVRAIVLLRENKMPSVVAGEQSYLALSQYASGSKRFQPPFRSGEADCFSEQKSRLQRTLLARWDKIDGNDVRDVTQRFLRSQIGVVLREPFLFTGTIPDQIRYGRLDTTNLVLELPISSFLMLSYACRACIPEWNRIEQKYKRSPLGNV